MRAIGSGNGPRGGTAGDDPIGISLEVVELAVMRVQRPRGGGTADEVSQTFTVWSPLPLASRLPSGLNATLMTSFVCLLRVSDSWPVAASQTFTNANNHPSHRHSPHGIGKRRDDFDAPTALRSFSSSAPFRKDSERDGSK